MAPSYETSTIVKYASRDPNIANSARFAKE